MTKKCLHKFLNVLVDGGQDGQESPHLIIWVRMVNAGLNITKRWPCLFLHATCPSCPLPHAICPPFLTPPTSDRRRISPVPQPCPVFCLESLLSRQSTVQRPPTLVDRLSDPQLCFPEFIRRASGCTFSRTGQCLVRLPRLNREIGKLKVTVALGKSPWGGPRLACCPFLSMVLDLACPTLSQPCLAPVNHSDFGLYREPKVLHSLGLNFILETNRAITPTQSSGRELWQPSRHGPLWCLVSQGHSPACRGPTCPPGPA